MNEMQWYWEDLCGPEGFQLWSQKTHDLGICFEQLCLQLPVLAVLSVVSAYYTGRQVEFVIRGRHQLAAINIRCIIASMFAFLPILQVYFSLESDGDMNAMFYVLSIVQCLAWLCHLGYSLALRRRLGRSARGPVFVVVLWTMLAACSAISLRSNMILYGMRDESDRKILVYYGFSIVHVIFHIFYGLTLIPNDGDTVYVTYERFHDGERQNLLTNSGNAFSRFSEEQDPNYLGVGMEDIPWLSKVLFYWVNPLMKKGAEGKLLHPDDLFDLPDNLNSTTLSRKLDDALIGKQSNGNVHEHSSNSNSSSLPDVSFMQAEQTNVSLIRALHNCFWFQFYGIGLLKLTADCAGFAGPMLLYKLVSFIEDKAQDVNLGYAYAAGLCLTTLLGALCNAHFNFLMSMVGLKIRAALVTTIYKKTLSVGGTVLKSAFSDGEIVNFMSTDTDRVVNACPSFHALWSIPFQIAVTLFLLYNQVGIAFLAGVGFSILLIPINKVIANIIGNLSTKMMEQKDNRVKMMTEILRGIRSIKVHVWETHFIKLISKIRNAEVKYLKGRKYLDALCVYFWATTPVLISVLTIGTYVALGNKLTASTVFTTIALLNMLISPLNAFAWVLNGVVEAWVSVKRIQRLLDLPNLDMDQYYDASVISESNYGLVIKGGEFNWGKLLTAEERTRLHSTSRRRNVKDKGVGKKSSKTLEGSESQPEELAPSDFYLREINVCIRKGEFVGIIGTVGSGKSSVLNAILAELTIQGGQVAVADLELGFGYVAQQAWLQRGTLRDNILFGRNYDESKYTSVLHACGLFEDLKSLPGGDLTGVGDGGMTLSGGQKARVSLARAVYQDKPIYLLDDIISAVDVKVAKHIFQHCIVGLLKNRNKTVILCSHHVNFLSYADRILVMENGTIVKEGRPEEILDDMDLMHVDLELEDSLQTSSVFTESIRTDSSPDMDSILNEESRETGTVRASVYGSYWKAVGHLLSFAILLTILLMQTSRNSTDLWLSFWVTNSNANESHNDNNTRIVYYAPTPDIGYTTWDYLLIYCLFVLLNSIFSLLRAFLFAYGGVQAATKIHKQLLKSIMKSKVTFFDFTPIGRILNRFSSDTYTVDDSLPFIINILMAQFFGLLGAVIITIYGLPWLTLVLVPLIPIYSWLQSRYRLTSRELKRLSSVTLSPVYNHFNESLQGLSTIRAFRTMRRFKRDNEENVEVNQKAQFASQAAAQWLGLRLQFIGVAMVTGVGLLAVIQHQFDLADPGLVGLAISYALSVTGLLGGVVNAFTETEREMIAVERVNQYVDEVTPEKSSFIMVPPYAWPSQGVISFNNVVLKYRDHLVPSLKRISFETRPAEKIGVVGRTGAGKSSLLTSLFRMVELSQGVITVDTVNISHISIDALRSRIYCIPQDPFLFSGSVRENLDPLEEFQVQEIWYALGVVDLSPTIRRMGGLEAPITNGGSNLSVGQRQLFCLARAILHKAKILCIDEATANVDHATDRVVQQTLRSAFRKSTVINIAHRIQTVIDCDRVLVMSDGEIVEFDNPQTLLDDTDSHFYKLVNAE